MKKEAKVTALVSIVYFSSPGSLMMLTCMHAELLTLKFKQKFLLLLCLNHNSLSLAAAAAKCKTFLVHFTLSHDVVDPQKNTTRHKSQSYVWDGSIFGNGINSGSLHCGCIAIGYSLAWNRTLWLNKLCNVIIKKFVK